MKRLLIIAGLQVVIVLLIFIAEYLWMKGVFIWFGSFLNPNPADTSTSFLTGYLSKAGCIPILAYFIIGPILAKKTVGLILFFAFVGLVISFFAGLLIVINMFIAIFLACIPTQVIFARMYGNL